MFMRYNKQYESLSMDNSLSLILYEKCMHSFEEKLISLLNKCWLFSMYDTFIRIKNLFDINHVDISQVANSVYFHIEFTFELKDYNALFFSRCFGY